MKDLTDVHVAILAGGLGTRLVPLIPGQQKVVAKVKQHPFLEYILNQLNKAGFKKVVICTGYLGEQVKKEFGKKYGNLSISYSQENSKLDTAGAIRLALPLFTSGDILVTNGDSYFDCDLKKFYQFHLGKKANGTIALKEVFATSRYGKVELDENGQIVGFEEKKENGGAGLINGGIYLFKRSFLTKIPENNAVSFEKDMFPVWVGKSLYGFKCKGRFIDIGTPQSYKEVQNFFHLS